MVERPRPLMPRDNARHDLAASSSSSSTSSSHLRNREGANGVGNGSGNKNGLSKRPMFKHSSLKRQSRPTQVEKPLRIVYQFLYNNNSRQQTEAREDLHCPWCALNCIQLYSLLKHLKLSHPRFLFTYVPIEEGARIDVSVSDLFDSTYAGNPHDIICQPPGYAFSRQGPVQRTSITNILVCRPKRTQPSLSEFLEADGDNDQNGPYDGQRPFVTGHNRLYHYATSNLPMPPHAIIVASTEDQVDPPWLNTKICRMIDEFSDVNEGEKEFMKMWNLHVQHHTYVGDCQMKMALREFVEERARDIADRNLFRNFVVHCCNLSEFGVLGPAHVFSAVTRMQKKLLELGVKTATEDRTREQWADWEQRKTGIKQLAKTNFAGIFNKNKKKDD